MKNKENVKKSDFNANFLPRNRRKQFFDILKNRKPLLFKIGLFCLFFSLLFIVCEVLKDIQLINISVSTNTEEYDLQYYNIQFLFESIKSISIFIYALLLSGLCNVFVSLLWERPVIFLHNFKIGIKKNIKVFALFSFFLFFIKALFIVTSYMFSNLEWISYLIYGANIVFICPFFITAYFINAYYENTFSNLIKNSLKFYVISFVPTLIKSLLIFIIILGYEILPVFGLIPLIVKFVLLLLIPLVIMPIYILGCFEHQLSLFDKYINKDNYPQFYKLGLSKGEGKK